MVSKVQDLVPFTCLRGNGGNSFQTNELQTDCIVVSKYESEHTVLELSALTIA